MYQNPTILNTLKVFKVGQILKSRVQTEGTVVQHIKVLTRAIKVYIAKVKGFVLRSVYNFSFVLRRTSPLSITGCKRYAFENGRILNVLHLL
jgi:hypothetical protein